MFFRVALSVAGVVSVSDTSSSIAYASVVVIVTPSIINSPKKYIVLLCWCGRAEAEEAWQ